MFAEGAFVRLREDVRSAGLEEAEALAVGGAIHDAGVGGGTGDLVAALLDGGGAISLEFVFPADDDGLGKERAEAGEEFLRGAKREDEFGSFAGDFFRRAVIPDKGEIAQRRRVKDRVGRVGKFFQFVGEGGICREGDDLGRGGSGMGGHLAPQADDTKSRAVERLREDGAEFSSGVIGDAADAVNRLIGRAAGHEGKGHEATFNAQRPTLNSEVTERAGAV